MSDREGWHAFGAARLGTQSIAGSSSSGTRLKPFCHGHTFCPLHSHGARAQERPTCRLLKPPPRRLPTSHKGPTKNCNGAVCATTDQSRAGGVDNMCQVTVRNGKIFYCRRVYLSAPLLLPAAMRARGRAGGVATVEAELRLNTALS